MNVQELYIYNGLILKFHKDFSNEIKVIHETEYL